MTTGAVGTGRLPEAFADIQRRWPDATMTADRQGGYLVRIPAMPVFGYTQSSTWVEFALPVGFPFARPEHFETDGALRVVGGGIPRWTDLCDDGSRLHWYHRLMAWDPNRDTIINYVGSIIRRLSAPAERDAQP